MQSRTPQVVKLLFPEASLHHIGMALPHQSNLNKTLQQFLPYTQSTPKDLPTHGVCAEFLVTNKGDFRTSESAVLPELELIYPLGEDSPLNKFLEKKSKRRSSPSLLFRWQFTRSNLYSPQKWTRHHKPSTDRSSWQRSCVYSPQNHQRSTD